MNNLNKGNKIFLPMSIDQNTTHKTSYFLSPTKMAVAIAVWTPSIIVSFYMYSGSGNQYPVMFATFLLYMFFYSFFFRYFVLEEKRLKKMLKNLESNKKSKSDYFWGIDEVDDDGIIHYRYNNGIKKGVVVKVNRGSTVGKPENFVETHNELTLKFIRSLLKSGFSYTKYSRLEPKSIPPVFHEYIHLMSTIKDEAQRQVMKLNLDTMNKFTLENKNIIVDYYLITTDNLRLIKTFKNLVRDSIVQSFGNEVYFKGSKILDANEVISFIADSLTIKSVSRKGYYDTNSIDFNDYGSLFRIIDREGHDVPIALLNEFEKDVYESGGRSSGRTLDNLEKELDKENEREEKRASKSKENVDSISLDSLEEELENDIEESTNSISLGKSEELIETVEEEEEELEVLLKGNKYYYSNGKELTLEELVEFGLYDESKHGKLQIEEDEDIFNL